LVIISGDQPQGFYDTYAANHARFEAYVAGGGIVEFHAAAWGWNGGDLSGIPLPGGVEVIFSIKERNYVEDPSHPLVAGVPNPMWGSGVSHGYLTGTLTSTTIICTEGTTPGGHPTLIEYPYGSGLVIASGQVLEFGYSQGADAGIVLQNMIPYAYSRGTGSSVLLASDQDGTGSAGAVVSYTLTLRNYTGQTDSFELAALGNTWPTTFWAGGQITSTGSVPDEGVIHFTARVAIPASALPGDADAAMIQATSVTFPTVYSDTVTIHTTVLCSPALIFSGRSAQTMGNLDDLYDYGGQGFTYIYVYGYSGDDDSLNATVSGYDAGHDTWQTIGQQSGGGSGTIVDQFFIPPAYSQVRVLLDDGEASGLICYDYRFTVCREPAMVLNPPLQAHLASAGATANYTQTVTNYTMGTDSFDLTATGNAWPTTFWDGSTRIDNTGPLADLEAFTFRAQVDVPADAAIGDSHTATIRAASVTVPGVSATVSLQASVLAYPWVEAFSDEWASDGFTDMEQYLDIMRPNGIVRAQMTDDEHWPYSSPVVAAYPREAIVAAWTGPFHLNDTVAYHNLEYTAVDVDGDTVIPISQVSDNAGATLYYTGDHYPTVAVAPTDGNVLIAWQRVEADDVAHSRDNVYYTVRGPDGSQVLSPTALTTNTTNAELEYYPSAAAFGDGHFAIAWQHSDGSGSTSDIYYTVLDSSGSPITGPVNLTNNTVYNNQEPRANRLADSSVLVAWNGQHGSGSEIYYAVLDSAGKVTYPATRLTDALYDVHGLDAVGLRNGKTLIAWEQSGYYPTWGQQIAYAMLDSGYDVLVSPPVLANPHSNLNYFISLARDGDDNAVLTWRGNEDQRIYYALVDNNGAVRTWPTVLRTAHDSQINLIGWGAASGSLPEPAPDQGRRIFLPVVLKGSLSDFSRGGVR
jgi:hypothetical protein